MNETLSSILLKGLNNPDCSFYVGNMFGQYTTFKIAFMIVIFYFFVKLIDRLALEPFLEWIKNKLYKVKK